MDRYGRDIFVNGFAPQKLLIVEVKWFLTILVLAGLPTAQLIMVIVIALLSTRAVIKDTTFIAAAQLLKPALNDLGSHGSILSGDEIADQAGDVKLCYGARGIAGSGGYNVDVIYKAEQIEHQQGTTWLPGKTVPQGLYDGSEKK